MYIRADSQGENRGIPPLSLFRGGLSPIPDTILSCHKISGPIWILNIRQLPDQILDIRDIPFNIIAIISTFICSHSEVLHWLWCILK